MLDMDRKELEKIIDSRSSARAREVVANALRAVMTGGDFGYWTRKRFPILVKAKGNGALDRIFRLEKKK